MSEERLVNLIVRSSSGSLIFPIVVPNDKENMLKAISVYLEDPETANIEIVIEDMEETLKRAAGDKVLCQKHPDGETIQHLGKQLCKDCVTEYHRRYYEGAKRWSETEPPAEDNGLWLPWGTKE